mgnify:CR=1 FL=1
MSRNQRKKTQSTGKSLRTAANISKYVLAHMGVGSAAGKGKAEEAARQAISSPLLETSINGAGPLPSSLWSHRQSPD